MLEAYRVIKPFIWNGYQYTPSRYCKCTCYNCTNSYASQCSGCRIIKCKCSCTMNSDLHAGSIWLVEAGHPRKSAMLRDKFAIYDAGIDNISSLLRDKKYTRLLAR